jgi:multiple sugar transport system substrate-binding protein
MREPGLHMAERSATVRRIVAGSAVALGVFLLWLVCPGRRVGHASTDGDTTEIQVWSGWTGHEREAFEEIVDAFNASHPGLRLRNVSTAADDTRIFRALVGGAPPDLCFIWNSEYIGALAENGALLCLDPYLARSGPQEEEFLAAALAQCKYEGRTYALPYLADVYALFWNKDIFRAAQLDPDCPPATLEELVELAESLTEIDDSGTLVQMGIAPFELFIAAELMGGGFYEPETRRVTADNQTNVRALEFQCDLIERQGGIETVDAFSAGFGEYASSRQEFFAGKVAMTISGQWWPSFIELFAPEMDYGVCAIAHPRDRPDLAGTTHVGGNFICIPTGSPHAEEAWEFLRWTQTREAQTHFSRVMHGVPNLRAMLKLPELTRGSREKEAFGVMCDIAGLGKGAGFPVTPVNMLYLRELELATEFATHGTKSPEEALRDVTVRVQRELDACLRN